MLNRITAVQACDATKLPFRGWGIVILQLITKEKIFVIKRTCKQQKD